MATAAAAGSGEFHVYKHSRRREFERVKLMEQRNRAVSDGAAPPDVLCTTDRQEEEQAEFLAKKAEREAAADAKTAKNRAKRQKRKGKKGDGLATNGAAEADADEEGGTKRKLAGGAGLVFRRPGEENAETKGAGTQQNERDTSLTQVPYQDKPQARSMAVEEREIIIHDDE